MNDIIELFRIELIKVSCLKDTTVRVYLDMVYKYLNYAHNLLHINPLTSQTRHILKWIYHLKTIEKGYNFIKDTQVALKSFFAFLVKTGYINKNPADTLPRVKIPKSTLNKPLATETLFTLLKSFDRNKWMGMRNFTIVSILWALGLRVNELLKMKRKDINLEYDREHKTGTLLVHGKGGKERTLFIVDTLYEVISRYLSLKKTQKRQGSFLFPGTKEKTIGRTRVRQLIMEAAKRIGTTARVTPHVFRHTFATNMYHQKVPVEAIQEMMGHETVRETSVYIHVSDELMAEVLNKISIKENVS
ncbi:MAG: tyrosine-type recombinase/integrase [Elusimicrobia bacterium]|nr:tyrosine-type recombinase/integrase [Elusimicrobiota bacterium]